MKQTNITKSIPVLTNVKCIKSHLACTHSFMSLQSKGGELGPTLTWKALISQHGRPFLGSQSCKLLMGPCLKSTITYSMLKYKIFAK